MAAVADSSVPTGELTALRQFFTAQYGRAPHYVVQAPGRINLIGEHIDYNGYPVLPIAMKQSIFIAVSPNTDDKVRIMNYIPNYSHYTCDVSQVSKISKPPAWYDYVLCGIYGVQKELPHLILPGMDLAIMGKVPMSAGLSSSSALVCGTAVATNAVLDHAELASTVVTNGTTNGVATNGVATNGVATNGVATNGVATNGVATNGVGGHHRSHALSMEKLAQVCAQSEKYVGTEGGGMDQAACLLSQKDSAQLISFNPLKCTVVTLPKGATFVVGNSLQQINKAATCDFNQRVMECKLACSILAKHLGQDWKNIPNLAVLQRKLNKSLEEMIELVKQTLHAKIYTINELAKLLLITPEVLSKTFLSQNTQHVEEFKLRSRALHVFSEAKRVFAFKKICDDWHAKHSAGEDADTASVLAELGTLMFESHASARYDYECSHPALDQLVELSKQHAVGARLTGAGWGGCMVALVEEDKLAAHCAALTRQYYDSLGIDEYSVKQALFASHPESGCTIYTD